MAVVTEAVDEFSREQKTAALLLLQRKQAYDMRCRRRRSARFPCCIKFPRTFLVSLQRILKRPATPICQDLASGPQPGPLRCVTGAEAQPYVVSVYSPSSRPRFFSLLSKPVLLVLTSQPPSRNFTVKNALICCLTLSHSPPELDLATSLAETLLHARLTSLFPNYQLPRPS